jgi:hypothetical protein
LIDMDYQLMVCPLTKVHVLYLNPEVGKWNLKNSKKRLIC